MKSVREKTVLCVIQPFTLSFTYKFPWKQFIKLSQELDRGMTNSTGYRIQEVCSRIE